MTFKHRTQKHLDKCRSLVNRVSTKVAATTAIGAAMIGNAQAQDASSAAAAAFADVQSTGADMAGYAWPVVGAITAALIGIKLFKKFANRAS